MKLDIKQNKIVESKVNFCSLIKGSAGTGKTSIAAYRAIFLENNYCLYNNDRILVVCSCEEKVNKFKDIYSSISRDAEERYWSLLKPKGEVIDIVTMDDLIKKHCDKKIISAEEKIFCIEKAFEEVKVRFPEITSYKDEKFEFLLDEIKWIKSFEYLSIEEYQKVDRVGRRNSKKYRVKRINKNSRHREAIFKLMAAYNKVLRKNELMDKEDTLYFLMKKLKGKNSFHYTHIIVDDAENYTKAEISFIKAFTRVSTYATMLFNFNKDNIVNENAWFIREKNFSGMTCKFKIKNYLLKKNYIDTKSSNFIKSMEEFQYNDLRHGKSFNFVRDIDNKSEIILPYDDIKYNEEEMNEIPIFTDIAAGEPIMINPEITDRFYIPKYWVNGMKNCFMLKIKGDSMINADIDDGDYVVIRQETAAQNKDIVAADIDGSATLKRLIIDNGQVLLMPENDKYKPITVNEEEGIRIIGVAVGVLKIK